MQSGAIRPIPNMLPRHLFNEEHEAFRKRYVNSMRKKLYLILKNMKNNNMLTEIFGIKLVH